MKDACGADEKTRMRIKDQRSVVLFTLIQASTHATSDLICEQEKALAASCVRSHICYRSKEAIIMAE
jgi:hypothetical protein